MPENTMIEFLEIENDENSSKQRIASLINKCDGNFTMNINKSELKTFPLKPPENSSDNKELVKKVAKDINIENVEGTERIIEMNLGLGVFEQIKEPLKYDIIMDPKGSTSNTSTKPKIIMVDNETKNGAAINELSQKAWTRKKLGYQTPEGITDYKRPEGLSVGFIGYQTSSE
ncbi:17645_t:CDS:2 [Funneliformis geosporum]|nr:17645_t:CDS:2 [Funneliformis geosporum]